MKHTIRTWSISAICLVAIVTACSTSDGDKPSVNLSGGEPNKSTGVGGSLGGAVNTPGLGGAANPTAAGGAVNIPATGGVGNVSAAAGSINNPAVEGSSSVAGSGPVVVAGAPSIGGTTSTSTASDCYDTVKKCHTCTSSNKALLNRCTDGRCIPYDNKTLKKLNADGSVPALPYPI